MHSTFPQLPLAMLATSGSEDRLPLQMLVVFGSAKLLAELAQRKHRLATLGEEAGLSEEVARLRARLRAMQGETSDA